MKKSTSTKAPKAKVTAAAKTPAAVKAPVAAKTAAPVKVAPAKASTTVKKTAPKAAQISIVAQIDVGFGNTLFLRGEGPGLSWERGVPMDCVADDRWSIAVTESGRPYTFKFLLNDEIWCAGEDYSLPAGQNGTFYPEF